MHVLITPSRLHGPAAAVFVGAVALSGVAGAAAAGVAAVAAAGVAAARGAGRVAPQGVPRMVAVDGAGGIDFVHRYGGEAKRYITEMAGSGGAWIDYDVDGDLDALLVQGLEAPGDDPLAATAAAAPGAGGHRLFRQTSGRFAPVPGDGGLGDRAWGNAAAVADVDNDGLADVLVTAIGADRLYRNNGDGTFAAWRAGVEDEGWSTGAAFLDWDRDGDLDLYVARYVDFDAEEVPALGDGVCFYRGIEVLCGPDGLTGAGDALYRNEGDGRFSPWPGVPVDPERTYGFAVVATDCDDDARPDLYVAADMTINLLYRHAGAGEPGLALEDLSLFGGAGYSGDGREQSGMGATAADYDGDGRADLFVTNFQNDHNTLYRNGGDCVFADVSAAAGLAASSFDHLGWATHFVDIDGDADQDLFVANGHIYPQVEAAGLEAYGQRNLLHLNRLREEGEARFVEVGRDAGPGMALERSSRAALRGDWDDDFDHDLLVTNIDARPTLLRNDGPVAAPALRLTLVGRTSNRSAYGARVDVVSDGVRQRHELRVSDGYAGSNDPRLLVHLPGGVAELVEVRWPGGARTRLEGVGPGWLVLDETHGVIARRSAAGSP